MAHHVMPAGVPGFLQIMQVRNVGADGSGNSVSGSKARSAHAFPAWINRNPRKGWDGGGGHLQGKRFGA